MTLSLAGLVGAAVGVAIGLIDFGLVAMLVRRALEKRNSSAAAVLGPKGLDVVMKVLFVVNALVFAGLGYWFGATLGG